MPSAAYHVREYPIKTRDPDQFQRCFVEWTQAVADLFEAGDGSGRVGLPHVYATTPRTPLGS